MTGKTTDPKGDRDRLDTLRLTIGFRVGVALQAIETEFGVDEARSAARSLSILLATYEGFNDFSRRETP